MNTKNLSIVLALAVLVLIVLLLQQCKSRKQDQRESLALVTALNDTLSQERLSTGEMKASIAVLETESVKDFLDLQLKDSTLRELQVAVKENKRKLAEGSAVIQGQIETIIALKARKPEIKYLPGDTVEIDGVIALYPTYSDSVINKWIQYRATMSKDSASFSLLVDNKFTAVLGKEKGKSFIELTTDNPYSKTKSLRVYQKGIKAQKRFGIGPNVSYSIGENFKFKPTIGIGLQYSLIRL